MPSGRGVVTDPWLSRTMALVQTFTGLLAENGRGTIVELLYSDEPLNVAIRGFHIEILTL